MRRAPCTRTGHHAYLGGLLEHTVAVATLAQELALGHPRLNSDLLICAAIVHDIGKTREFTYGATIGCSDEGRLLGHVQIGLRLLRERAGGALDEGRLLALEHCVLCHHGADAAPAGRFASVEALALYRLNSLDAAVKGALEHGLDARAPRGEGGLQAELAAGDDHRGAADLDPLDRALEPSTRAYSLRRAADLGSLRDLDLLAEGDRTVAREVQRERSGRGAGRRILVDADAGANIRVLKARPAPAKQLTL